MNKGAKEKSTGERGKEKTGGREASLEGVKADCWLRQNKGRSVCGERWIDFGRGESEGGSEGWKELELKMEEEEEEEVVWSEAMSL